MATEQVGINQQESRDGLSSNPTVVTEILTSEVVGPMPIGMRPSA